jgi:Trehalose utilisation
MNNPGLGETGGAPDHHNDRHWRVGVSLVSSSPGEIETLVVPSFNRNISSGLLLFAADVLRLISRSFGRIPPMRKLFGVRAVVAAVVAVLASSAGSVCADDLWIKFEGGEGPGKGKHVVLVSGDEEYRSEEALPQLAKILSKHHGFHCTVVFAIDPANGEINPNKGDNIPGLDALDTADLMIIATRFRHLPDDQMKHIADYVEAGKPVIGMRTATHAFNGGGTYARYSNGSNVEGWKGGFGKQVLGEQWVNHHGHHGKEGTRGIIVAGQERNPIVRGIEPGSIFGTTDVYTVVLDDIAKNCQSLVLGEVTETLESTSKPVEGKKNDPMMPVAWTRLYKSPSGKEARIFNTTMGAATDLEYEGTRRMLVNATYWVLGMEDKIPEKSNVEIVGEYKPTNFGFNGYVKGRKPADYAK